MIDFTPDQPGGAIYWIVVAWAVAGLMGIVWRSLLLRKFRVDLRRNGRGRFADALRAISRRRIEQSLIHIAVKVWVVAIGVAVAVIEFNMAEPAPPNNVAALALLAIPLLLDFDGWREYRHQNYLLRISDVSELHT